MKIFKYIKSMKNIFCLFYNRVRIWVVIFINRFRFSSTGMSGRTVTCMYGLQHGVFIQRNPAHCRESRLSDFCPLDALSLMTIKIVLVYFWEDEICLLYQSHENEPGGRLLKYLAFHLWRRGFKCSLKEISRSYLCIFWSPYSWTLSSNYLKLWRFSYKTSEMSQDKTAGLQ